MMDSVRDVDFTKRVLDINGTSERLSPYSIVGNHNIGEHWSDHPDYDLPP